MLPNEFQQELNSWGKMKCRFQQENGECDATFGGEQLTNLRFASSFGFTIYFAKGEISSFMRKMALLRSVIYEKSCWISHIPLGFHI